MPEYTVKVGGADYDVTAPDENTAWQWANMYHAQAATPTPEAPTEEKPGSAFGRGLSRSVDITQQGIGSALEGIGRSTGFSGLEQYGAGVAARNTKELEDAEKNATRRQDVTGVGTGLSYAGEALGESAVPMTVGIGAGALTGAAVGSAFGPLGTLAGLGIGAAGAAVSQIPLFYGWNREDQKEAVKQGIIPEVSEGAAFLTAIPQAALEGIADKLLPGGGKFITKAGAGLFTRLAAGAGTGIVTEVPTEVGQQVLSRLQAGRSLSDDEAMSEYLDAAVGAGVVGGGIGGVGGAFSRSKKAATQETEGETPPPPPPGAPATSADPVDNTAAFETAFRRQRANGLSEEEAIALAQEEVNELGKTNQRPAGESGDVRPEPSVSPPSGEGVDARVADPATGAAGAGLEFPSGPAQQVGTREVNVPRALDEVAVEPVKNVINQVAEAPPIKGIPYIRDEDEGARQERQYEYEQKRELELERENYEGEVLPTPEVISPTTPTAVSTATPILTLDPSTPKKARTTQAIEAVKAIVATDAFKGVEVANKDINQAAQRLVNSNGGDPYVSLTRVLEGEPAVPKKIKAVAEEVPFEGAPEVAAPAAADIGYSQASRPLDINWLPSKQKAAEEAVQKQGNIGTSGPITASTETVYVDPAKLAEIPGSMNEQPGPGNPKYDALIKSIGEEGFDPKESGPLLVGINHRGEPYLMQGNNRAAAARDLGIGSVPVKFRWYAGGEDAGGFGPADITALVSKTEATPEAIPPAAPAAPISAAPAAPAAPLSAKEAQAEIKAQADAERAISGYAYQQNKPGIDAEYQEALRNAGLEVPETEATSGATPETAPVKGPEELPLFAAADAAAGAAPEVETEADTADEKITEASNEWESSTATATSATEALEEAVSGHDVEAYEKGLNLSLRHMGPKFLSKLLSALPGSSVIRWASKYIPDRLQVVRELVDVMVAERMNLLRSAGEISNRYKAFVEKHGQKALSAVMAKARIRNVNPTEFANVAEALKNDTVVKHLEGKIANTNAPGQLSIFKSDLAKRRSHIEEVHTLWDALGKQKGGHELYKEVRQYYKDMYRVLRSRWIANAKSQVKGEENKKALEASLKAIEDEVQAPDPDYFHGAPKPKVIDQYSPFMRFGEFSLRVEKTGSRERSYERFDTAAQWRARVAEIAKELGVSPKNKMFKMVLEKDEDSYDPKNASKTVQSMYDTIDKSQVLGGDLDAAKMELKRQLNEILLSNLPERSLGQRQIRAENVEGYSMDFFRVFNTSAASYANQLPRIKYAPKIRSAIEEASLYVQNNYSGETAAKLQQFVDEIDIRAEEAITPPQRSATVGFLNRVAFLFLLSSGASAATQLTSIPIRVLPALGSRYGFGRASAKLAVFSNFYNSVGVWEKQSDGTEKFVWPSMEYSSIIKSNPLRSKFFRALQERGVFNDTPTEAITQMGATPETVKLTGEGATAGAMALTRKGVDIMAAAFHSSEMISRQIAAMSRAELAYEAAMKKRPGVDFDQKAFDAAVDEAVQGNRDTLGDYSEFERPRIMNADLARFVFQFKNYAVTTTKFFLENANAMLRGETLAVKTQAMKEFIGVLTMGSMFFGVTGLPLYGVVTLGIDAFLNNLGDEEDKDKRNWANPLTASDSDQRFRYEFLNEQFGNITVPGITGDQVKLSAIIESGPVSALLDQNWSRRTQFNDLWFRFGLPGDTMAQSAKNFVLANLGPSVSLGDNFARAIDDFSNGDILRGLIKMNPAFTKGIFNAYQLKTEGATTTRGETILGPAAFSDYNLVGAVFGIQTDRLARLQNEKFASKGEEVKQERAKTKILGRYSELSTSASTIEDFQALGRAIKAYNQRYPLPHMRIEAENLENSLNAALAKKKYSAYGSNLTPNDMRYKGPNIMAAAPPKQ